MVCVFELIIASILRIMILNVFEPKVFNLFPNTPSIILPWALHEHGYLPRRITMYMFSFINGCFVGPIIEELFKLRMLRYVMWNLDHNKKRVVSGVNKHSEKYSNLKDPMHSIAYPSPVFQFTPSRNSNPASKTA